MIINSSFGAWQIQARAGRLAGISFRGALTVASPDFPDDRSVDMSLLLETARQLREYFDGLRREFQLPLATGQLTEFEQVVLAELHRIPFGSVCSYSEVAERIGRPNAARAVGNACHRNPFLLVIPCHRVIGKSGGLTGFGVGLELKRKLLDFEQKTE